MGHLRFAMAWRVEFALFIFGESPAAEAAETADEH
jgi:hypothetical protein